MPTVNANRESSMASHVTERQGKDFFPRPAFLPFFFSA